MTVKIMIKSLLLLILLFSGNYVYAEDDDWPSHQWQLNCQQSCKNAKTSSAKLKEMTSELKEIGKWLERLGFVAPKLKAKNPYKVEVVVIVREDGSDELGSYVTEKEFLSLSPLYLEQNDSSRGTAAHEFFHSIYYNYDAVKTFISKHGESGDWLTEGSAEAVGIAWLEKKKLPNNPENGDFDYPLHMPTSQEFKYSRGLFFYDMGRHFLQYRQSQIEYLHHMFSAFRPSNSKLNGLNAVDSYFISSSTNNKGLYEHYPSFIARYSSEALFKDAIDDISISFPGGEKEITKTVSRKVRQVASDPINLSVDIPEGFFGSLRIEILDSFDDLHLIVDEGRYDSHKRNDKRNVADFSVSYDEEYFIRVSNIAKNAIDTKDNVSYKLKLTLTPETSCGKPRLSMLEMVGAEGLNENGMPPGKGVMRVSGSIYGTGEVCSDVVTGVPSFQSGAAGIFSLGNNVSFQLYTPGTNTIKIRGVDWPYHGGVGGWLPDSRYEIGVRLPDIKWEDIKEGETYPADVRIQYMHWQGELTETTSEGIPIRYLTGTKTQSWPTYNTHNGSVKIIRKRPSSDVNGGTNILVELVVNNKYGKGTFTKSNLSVKTRSDGYIYSVEEGHESLDTIILYSKIDIHCISHKCRD